MDRFFGVAGTTAVATFVLAEIVLDTAEAPPAFTAETR
jgi:hypothetical protein